MKKILSLIFIAGMFAACSEPLRLDNGDKVLLDKWTLSQDGGNMSFDVTVPSTVAGVLYDEGVLGTDLLEGLNYYNADKSVFDTPWTYRTAFDLDVVELGNRIFINIVAAENEFDVVGCFNILNGS